jgi:hypothetical protein
MFETLDVSDTPLCMKACWIEGRFVRTEWRTMASWKPDLVINLLLVNISSAFGAEEGS